MAQRNEVRGSEFSEYPVCAAEPVVIQFGKPDKWETLGFRLVRGAAEQCFRLVVDAGTERRTARGGFYPYDSHQVRDSIRPVVGRHCRYLGIRLAREGS
jgi:hypothetical protein